MQILIQRSQRKTISLQVKDRNTLLIKAPLTMPKKDIDAFIKSREKWIQNRLSKIDDDLPKYTKEELKLLSLQAKRVIPPLCEIYAKQLGVHYHQITIRHQRTRWGSCSSKGNLNFNCLLMLCPDEVRDSIIIHELCHLKEMNHSPAFYRYVYQLDPDYDKHRAWLKANGLNLIKRLPD